jgi:hypothetical protein
MKRTKEKDVSTNKVILYTKCSIIFDNYRMAVLYSIQSSMF